MSKPSRLSSLIATVTEDVVGHPNDLTRYYMGELNISRVGANNYIKQLEEQGVPDLNAPAAIASL